MSCNALSFVVSLLLAAGPLSSAQVAKPRPASRTPARDAKETAQQLLLDLREAKGLAAAIPDAKTRRRMEKLLDDLEAGIKELSRQPARRTALAKEDFDKLVNSLKANAFDQGKLAALNVSAKQAYFTCDQAKTLVQIFTFSDGRKQTAILLYPRLTDPVNFPTVLAVFTFDSERRAILQAVEGK